MKFTGMEMALIQQAARAQNMSVEEYLSGLIVTAAEEGVHESMARVHEDYALVGAAKLSLRSQMTEKEAATGKVLPFVRRIGSMALGLKSPSK